jgi:hypothetical protein
VKHAVCVCVCVFVAIHATHHTISKNAETDI